MASSWFRSGSSKATCSNSHESLADRGAASSPASRLALLLVDHSKPTVRVVRDETANRIGRQEILRNGLAGP